ncbi:hypothetical protein BS47DRAFT_1484289 [Hydnum rufescens UP504]|uniref:Uncharacterized protein n=1 Tax=Hydnum rufescens UP504 TaxID=1448309 RepID=A0A9P6B414_9AGAM|nr:hypothetical protein BS47DRAFT_1484289 [Hydnum rufescens UP504]
MRGNWSRVYAKRATPKPRGIQRWFFQHFAIFFHRLIMDPFSRARSTTTSSPLAALQGSGGLLASQSWFPIDPWREKVFDFKDAARSYVLVEARLYKNEYNVEHEFVMGEFRAGSNIIFVAAERVVNIKDSDHKMSDEERHRVLQEIKAEDERNREQKGKRNPKEDKSMLNIPKLKKTSSQLFSRVSTSDSSSIFSLSSSLGEHMMRADDRIRLILGVQDFDAAIKIVQGGKEKKTLFTSRGSLEYLFDAKPIATSTPIPIDPIPPHPTLLNLTSAIVAIQRSKPYYTIGRKNCYWFATGMMFILSQTFTPFEPIEFDIKQGTWSFGLITIPLGGLEKGEEGMLLLGLLPDRIESDDPPDRIPDSGFRLKEMSAPIRGL